MKSVLCHGGASLDVPGSVGNLGKLEFAHDLVRFKGKVKVLLISEDEDRDSSELRFLKQLFQLFSRLFKSSVIGRIDHINESISSFVVVCPVWSDRLLTSNVPDV